MGYEPAEAAVKLMGGNSDWRGPVWFPTSYLLIHSFLRFGDAVGQEFSLPTAGSDHQPVTPHEIAGEAADRMISIFKRGADGKRPCFGFYQKFQEDPHWNQCLLFNEYYHGDSGHGAGRQPSDRLERAGGQPDRRMAALTPWPCANGCLLAMKPPAGALIVVSTTASYRLIGGPSVSFLQALYMAVITLAGVGYGEIVDTSHNPALRSFQHRHRAVRRWRSRFMFSRWWPPSWWKWSSPTLSGGAECSDTSMGSRATTLFAASETPAGMQWLSCRKPIPHVVVDLSEENLKKLKELHPEALHDMLYVVGDATEEDILEKAGLSRAKGLIAALPLDKDNLVVTVIVRQRFRQDAHRGPLGEAQVFRTHAARRGQCHGFTQPHRRPAHGQRTDSPACRRVPRYHAEGARQDPTGRGDRGKSSFSLGRKRSAPAEPQRPLQPIGSST